jgi:hypothetical protein
MAELSSSIPTPDGVLRSVVEHVPDTDAISLIDVAVVVVIIVPGIVIRTTRLAVVSATNKMDAVLKYRIPIGAISCVLVLPVAPVP